jgi:citrate lyase subunit beta / citryl-CoA lyase
MTASARRSCLSVPGSSPRMLAKATEIGADELVLDLEDSVIAAQKDHARELVVEALGSPRLAGRTIAVRLNGPRTPWCHTDVIALARAPRPPDSIVLPKVESGGDLEFVERLLDGVERAAGVTTPIYVQALIETAAGLARINEIAAASPRLVALVLGYADLAASLGRSASGAADLAAWRPAQEAVLTAARAFGLQAIDGPHLTVSVDDKFRVAVIQARDAGFDGKWAIHPSQVPTLNDAFTPSQAEIERSRGVVMALEEARRSPSGAGAVALDGQMLDEAMRVGALRLLARAAAGREPC